MDMAKGFLKAPSAGGFFGSMKLLQPQQQQQQQAPQSVTLSAGGGWQQTPQTQQASPVGTSVVAPAMAAPGSQPQSVTIAAGGAAVPAAPASAPATPATTPGTTAAATPPRKKYVAPEIPNAVPLVAGVERIEPEVVLQLIQSGSCVLVDLRGDDRAAWLIPGALHVQAIDTIPFAQKIPGLLQRFQNQPLVIFTCQYSAHRAPQCANWYREQADSRQRVAILSGGFRAWEGTGLPVELAPESLRQKGSSAADAYALLQGAQFVAQAGGVAVQPAPAAAASMFSQRRG